MVTHRRPRRSGPARTAAVAAALGDRPRGDPTGAFSVTAGLRRSRCRRRPKGRSTGARPSARRWHRACYRGRRRQDTEVDHGTYAERREPRRRVAPWTYDGGAGDASDNRGPSLLGQARACRGPWVRGAATHNNGRRRCAHGRRSRRAWCRMAGTRVVAGPRGTGERNAFGHAGRFARATPRSGPRPGAARRRSGSSLTRWRPRSTP
jgi:hypothetical protein